MGTRVRNLSKGHASTHIQILTPVMNFCLRLLLSLRAVRKIQQAEVHDSTEGYDKIYIGRERPMCAEISDGDENKTRVVEGDRGFYIPIPLQANCSDAKGL